MKLFLLSVGLVAFPCIALCDAIDATNFDTLWKTFDEAKKGQSAENIAIANKIVCNAGHGLDLKKPEDRETALARLRARFHGKTLDAVVMELKMEQASEMDQKMQKAEELVRERRELWKKRAANIPTIAPGVTRDQVLELLGEPDSKSGSPPYESWLYRCDAAHNEAQIWMDVRVIQITNGKVSQVTLMPERRAIEDVKPLKKANAAEEAPKPQENASERQK